MIQTAQKVSIFLPYHVDDKEVIKSINQALKKDDMRLNESKEELT